MKTPLGWAASRWTLSTRALRWATTSALIVSIIIVFTGGLVRVTGSGLGCPDWPTCEGSSLAPSAELGIHGVIEFANRLITAVIVIAVGWVIIAARLQKQHVRSVSRLAWSQFWLVIANAIAGGITVLVGLNPWVVALHFVLAIALLATTTLTWHRVRETRPGAEGTISRGSAALAWVLVAATVALIVFGTMVSGAGPHAGDSSDVPRMQLDWTTFTIIHGVLGALVFALTIALLRASRGTDARARLIRRRTMVFVVVLLAQGLVGLLQAVSGLPAALVSFHLLGAALVWVGVLRVLLDVRPALFAGVGGSRQTAADS
ncbi:MAG: heme A synthase [Salinibacterium sp.]|nr:heme A synthase [Salinibacterium sp.]